MKVLKLIGPDAGVFLERILACGVKKIAHGEGTRGVFLNGSSKVLGQFDLIHMHNEYWLVMVEEIYSLVKESIERMHFSEDFLIQDSFEMKICKRDLSVQLKENGFQFTVLNQSWPSIVPGYSLEPGQAPIPLDFHFERIAHLVPWPQMEWEFESNFALEAGMLPWIDRYKGCYPGQEVVEKSLNLGHPAKVLTAWEAEKSQTWNESDTSITSKAIQNNLQRVIVRVPWKKKDLPVNGWKLLKSQF